MISWHFREKVPFKLSWPTTGKRWTDRSKSRLIISEKKKPTWTRIFAGRFFVLIQGTAGIEYCSACKEVCRTVCTSGIIYRDKIEKGTGIGHYRSPCFVWHLWEPGKNVTSTKYWAYSAKTVYVQRGLTVTCAITLRIGQSSLGLLAHTDPYRWQACLGAFAHTDRRFAPH